MGRIDLDRRFSSQDFLQKERRFTLISRSAQYQTDQDPILDGAQQFIDILGSPAIAPRYHSARRANASLRQRLRLNFTTPKKFIAETTKVCMGRTALLLVC